MKYKSVVLTQRGGPEVLKVQEKVLRAPQSKEFQIKVMACGVGRTDVAMRYGYYPFAPTPPFVPGYEIVGTVSAVGSAVSGFKIGDKVAALSVYGGYAEYIFLEEEHLVRVPDSVRPEKAAAMILNYCTAYQMLHRVLDLKRGDTILITGASGGVGSALVDLGKLAGLNMYGTASAAKHEMIANQGVVPIDYKAKDWVKKLKKMEPQGLDYVIDGIGGAYINIGFLLLKKGGKLVEYGYPSFTGMLSGLFTLKLYSLYPNGKKGVSYGISQNYKKDKRSVIEDMKTLFSLLSAGKIQPLITQRFSILEAAQANQQLESGMVSGKIVLVSKDHDW